MVNASQDRTFPISLQERGRKALRQIAGLEEAIVAAGVFCNGSKLYLQQGKVRQIPRTVPILTIDRNCLVRIILEHLTQAYSSEQLTVKFSCQCIATDRRTKTVTLKPEQGEAFILTYDYLIAADGTRSLIRDDLVQDTEVQCDRFHVGDRILLIGDAAHAVSPSLGQGCNAALEDVLIFEQLLDHYEDDWARVLPAFSEQRVPDAHALRELSDYSFPRTRALVLEYFLRLRIRRVLHRWFPQWVQPFVFDLVFDYDLPYSQVLNLSQGWINKVKRLLSHAA